VYTRNSASAGKETWFASDAGGEGPRTWLAESIGAV
jgi:hypothetical protein